MTRKPLASKVFVQVSVPKITKSRPQVAAQLRDLDTNANGVIELAEVVATGDPARVLAYDEAVAELWRDGAPGLKLIDGRSPSRLTSSEVGATVAAVVLGSMLLSPLGGGGLAVIAERCATMVAAGCLSMGISLEMTGLYPFLSGAAADDPSDEQSRLMTRYEALRDEGKRSRPGVSAEADLVPTVPRTVAARRLVRRRQTS